MTSTSPAFYDHTATSTEDASSFAIAKLMYEEQVEAEYEVYCRWRSETGVPIMSLETFTHTRYILDDNRLNKNNGHQREVSEESMSFLREIASPDDEEEEFRGDGTDVPRAYRDEDDEGQDNYEALLLLGDRMGDVKAEQWTMMASRAIEQLPTSVYTEDQKLSAIYRAHGATYHADCGGYMDDTEQICLICQAEYEVGDLIRRLPCNHCFHADCVDRWLKQKDQCPTCRGSIQQCNT